MNSITRREFLGAAFGALAAGAAAAETLTSAPGDSVFPLTSKSPIPPTSRWFGFNICSFFIKGDDNNFEPWDFDFMVEHGFNFARFPLDYRIWTTAAGKYDEAKLKLLDEGIRLALDRKIHVLLCMHRGPGYTVAKPSESLQLFGNDAGAEKARNLFEEQWRMLAERYRDIPTEKMSFNLINEPPKISGSVYANAMTPAVHAIRKNSPHRWIVADGREWGKTPTAEFEAEGLIQATRGYFPFQLSHYKAEWVTGTTNISVPEWPLQDGFNAYLYSATRPELHSPLLLRGDFAENTPMTIHVDEVSTKARLVVFAGKKLIFDKNFTPGPGKGEWKESTFRPEWKNYQARYDRDYAVTLPECSEIRIEVSDGDWLTLGSIGLDMSGQVVKLLPGNRDWGKSQTQEVAVDSDGRVSYPGGKPLCDKSILWNDYVEPWRRFGIAHKTPVIVGEWGAYNKTPHDVAIAWMHDNLENFRRADFGWCLWNLQGSFGPVNSGRTDVKYEDYKGKKLDRVMLETLKAGRVL